MKVLGLAGWSGSGKTTLVDKLLPELTRRGFSVSTVKHAHHEFDVDKPGKDSYVHREAGATEVLVSSANRWALMHELRGSEEPSLESLMERMKPVDLILVEGFKTYGQDKLEVHRPGNGKPLLFPDDPNIVAVASDAALGDIAIAVLDLNDVAGIAEFVVAHCELTSTAKVRSA